MHGQHEWGVAKLRDCDDAVDRIEGGPLHCRRRREAARHHHDGVAVCRCLCGHFHADQPACAAAVVHDKLLAEVLGELGRELAGGDVAAAAGGERHDHAHCLGWVLLRVRNARSQRQERYDNGLSGKLRFHGVSSFLVIGVKFSIEQRFSHYARLSAPAKGQAYNRRALFLRTSALSGVSATIWLVAVSANQPRY